MALYKLTDIKTGNSVTLKQANPDSEELACLFAMNVNKCIDCTDCTNCTNCTDCTDCINCINCND